MRELVYSNGKSHCGKQCLDCGRLVPPNTWVSRALAMRDGKIPKWDTGLAERWNTEARIARQVTSEATRAERDREWHESHRQVLASPEWKEKTRLVRKRCNNLCEGCGKNSIAEVHHRHYRNLGQEFLFELIGLCWSCHKRIHDRLGEMGIEWEDFFRST